MSADERCAGCAAWQAKYDEAEEQRCNLMQRREIANEYYDLRVKQKEEELGRIKNHFDCRVETLTQKITAASAEIARLRAALDAGKGEDK